MPNVYDGYMDFSGGQNESLPPDRIGQNQFVRGINITTRDGFIGPRPGLIHKPIEVETQGGVGRLTYKQIFKAGKFQAAAPYISNIGRHALVVACGIIFQVDPIRGTARVLELPGGDRMNQYRRRIHWSIAGRFLVFFDYPNLPVIVENAEVRRADPNRVDDMTLLTVPELPISVLGAFNQNRLFVANEGVEFGASDPVGGINEDAPITFEESLAPSSAFLGQFFSLGNEPFSSQISAMGFLQVVDTSTGYGPLIVATQNSVYSFRSDIPRDDWENTTFGKIMLYQAGIAGPRAFTNLNADVIALSGDGQVRSLALSTGELERWASTPISKEVSKLIQEYANNEFVDLAVVAAHKNRVFITIAPYITGASNLSGAPVTDYGHGGLLVLELDNASVLGANANPAWAGIWTGISPVEMFTLDNNFYIVSKDDGGINRLYQLDEESSFDVFEGEEKNIISRVYTREFDFQSPFQDKRLEEVEVSLSDVEGEFSLLADYKPSYAHEWTLWRNLSHWAAVSCDESTCEEIPLYASQTLRETNLGDPEEVACDPITGNSVLLVRKVGLRLTLQGRKWRLTSLRIKAELAPEIDAPVLIGCGNIEEKKVLASCEPSDWEIYRTAPQDAEWPLPIQIF